MSSLDRSSQDRVSDGIDAAPGLQHKKNPMGATLKRRPKLSRIISVIAVIAFALSSGYAVWQMLDTSSFSANDLPAEKTVVVVPQPVTQAVNISGIIAAGKTLAVVAPFDGVIKEKRVQLGDRVEAGETLLLLEKDEIISRVREAQSAYLKAAMASQAMEQWETGNDMLRAKRAVDSARATYDGLDRQVNELKALFDQGIVSRNEYTGLIQQRDEQKNSLESAQDELNATELRGDHGNRELVALELQNAESRLNDAKHQMEGSDIKSSVGGVLIRPPASAGNREVLSTEPGARVERGTALLAIADTNSYTISGTVDEIDVNQVKIGQPVQIVSDAFAAQPIAGTISGVSAEADGENPPRFSVRASFVVPNERLRDQIKIGMSARMTAQIYANQVALLVPPEAISNIGDNPTVRLVTGPRHVVTPIRLGRTFPTGIEVLAGLGAGSVVAMPDVTGEERIPTESNLSTGLSSTSSSSN